MLSVSISSQNGHTIPHLYLPDHPSCCCVYVPGQETRNIFTNETSVMMPDNETVIEMKISVKNKDYSALHSVSKILLSPPVMDQIIGLISSNFFLNKSVIQQYSLIYLPVGQKSSSSMIQSYFDYHCILHRI